MHWATVAVGVGVGNLRLPFASWPFAFEKQHKVFSLCCDFYGQQGEWEYRDSNRERKREAERDNEHCGNGKWKGAQADWRKMKISFMWRGN